MYETSQITGSVGLGYKGATVACAPSKPIQEQMEIVGKLINELGETLAAFERDLEPITAPRVPSLAEAVKNSPPPTSPIAAKLESYATQLRSILRDTADLRSRIQV